MSVQPVNTLQSHNEPSTVQEKYVQQWSKMPTTGVAKLTPASWVPYVQLMRLNQPGILGALMPLLQGLTYGVSVHPGAPMKARVFGWEVAYWTVVATFIQGAACTWNDILDQDFDRRVPRTRSRPIARRAVSTRQAVVFMLAQLGVVVWLLEGGGFLPAACRPYCVAMGVLHALYPLTKRVMDFTPVFLGLPFCAMLLIAAVSQGVEVASAPVAALVMTELLWTIIYETIYAHLDAPYDVQAGVRSMAVRYRHSFKFIALVLGLLMVAAMALVGVLHRLSLLYFLVGCGGSALCLALILISVDLTSPASIQYWFAVGFRLMGACRSGAFFVEYLLRLV
ncbi:para-hydroxybenzoate--polyprenyltransferase, mitochondrial precursor (PHB:polyprenyltransferase) [Aspergillus niger]|nr:para-hydroxybenzoate--polyprenyltransferase, mitochondrial precursor (PHB:polyprenyltransferase) [Aspergillus niger]GLA41668.1 para-hydroxybenzoate--polyprenyltransferase, mitochondrial precursor (PHB:polyprenyltransferase) [Aspergillus niger]